MCLLRHIKKEVLYKKHVKTLNANTLKDTMKKADVASARLPASLHVRLPVPLVTRAAKTLPANGIGR